MAGKFGNLESATFAFRDSRGMLSAVTFNPKTQRADVTTTIRGPGKTVYKNVPWPPGSHGWRPSETVALRMLRGVLASEPAPETVKLTQQQRSLLLTLKGVKSYPCIGRACWRVANGLQKRGLIVIQSDYLSITEAGRQAVEFGVAE